MQLPVVAVVGRPNVGKSTLFNRLVGRRLAVVRDEPGVTRDRHYAMAHALGRDYLLVDTGGLDLASSDALTESIARQVTIAVEEADVILCVLDAQTEPTSSDEDAVAALRRVKCSVLYIANRADSERSIQAGHSHYSLGLDNLLFVSALHGHGSGALEEAMVAQFPPVSEVGEEEERTPRVAVVGRPNAGKSSLLNVLVGEERQVVHEVPGTTVDSIDSVVQVGDQPLVVTDTAGMRRQARVKHGTEAIGVIQSVRSVERSHGAILMIDADREPSEQDAKIAGLVKDRGRALVIGLNKVDLVTGAQRKECEEKIRELMKFTPWAPILPLSVKQGKGVDALMEAALASIANHDKRVGTGELNRFFAEVLENHPPPTMNKRVVRLYYITQARVRPPTFVIVSNRPDDVHFSYRRYVENQIRERFGFEGSPIRLVFKAKGKKPTP